MTLRAGAAVVVGVDGSDASRRAMLLAARFAASRDRPLRIVHAFVWPSLRVPLGPAPGGPAEGGLRHQAERIVDEAAAYVRSNLPVLGAGGQSALGHPVPLEMTTEIVPGAPVGVLLAEAESAAMVVLGHRGLGGFTGLLVGSVAVQVAAHAACPVVVARGEEKRGDEDRGEDVLVGVDGSPRGAAALEFAFDEASRRGVGLIALHAFRYPVAGEPGDMLPLVYDEAELRDEESEVLSVALAGWADRYPDVPVNRLMVRDRAAHALVHASHRAGLAVVGSRGHGGFTGLLLGSVSQAMLHHSECPLAIVR